MINLNLHNDIVGLRVAVCKAIAAIHGFPGAIVHGDIHPVQWLRSKDGTIKLNDFNNAEILDWSRKENSYCKADRGSWGGMVRALFSHVCLLDRIDSKRFP